MTALFLSLALLAYIIIPGILFRRIFHVWVPLRRIQWSRTDELTAFVVTLIVPAFIAFLLVRHTSFFAHHPFGFDDSLVLKWNDYKDILSASYSEKFFDANREALLSVAERVCQRQGHFLTWYYAATGLWALLCALSAFHYGNLRNYKWFAPKSVVFVLEKFAVPVISEWHAMFTPFTFAHSPERWVQVDALSTDGILYQGEAGLFHVGGEGQLSGFFLKNAKRFMRAEFTEAKKLDKSASKEKYWRQIPGESFYLPADKIANFNFTYIPKESLDTLAEENLKKMKISATVVIQPATVAVEPQSQISKPEHEDQVLSAKRQQNFIVCQHCILKGRPGLLPRVTAETPVVSRSDGRSYHLYLQLGPRRPSLRVAPDGAATYLAHFRYSLDSLSITNEPVTVAIKTNLQYLSGVLEIVETIADKLAAILEEGGRPAKFYKWDSQDGLTELMIPSQG